MGQESNKKPLYFYFALAGLIFAFVLGVVISNPSVLSITGNASDSYTPVTKHFTLIIQEQDFQVAPNGSTTTSSNTQVTTYNTSVITISSLTTPTSPATAKVQILPYSSLNSSTPGFSPDTIKVVIGVNNTVVWSNIDNATHTVTAIDGSFDSGNLNAGQSWNYTFTQLGTYQYQCSLHPWMIGTVIVVPAK